MSEAWANGAHAYLGLAVPGFPNFFLMRLAQAGGSFNYTSVAEEQSSYIAHIISRCI